MPNVNLSLPTYLTQSGSKTFANLAGADTYAGNLTPAISSYSNGLFIFGKVNNTSASACTLNINGVGAKKIYKSPLVQADANDLVDDVIYLFSYHTSYDAGNGGFLIVGGSGDVIGPASSTANAIALFDGTTGKLIKDSTKVLSTVGGNISSLTDPSAVTFIRINADNTVTARTAAEMLDDLGGDVFTISLIPGQISPSDSTTYYWGNGLVAPSATEADHDFNLGYAFIIIGVNMWITNTTSGSGENATFQFRNVTQGTSHSLGLSPTNGTSTVPLVVTFTGLNISVGASDFGCMQIDGPVWATNPTAIRFTTQLICKRI